MEAPAATPIRILNDVPPGDYTAQAVSNIYETFHRATVSTIKLVAGSRRGQHWNLAPGNLYSTPKKVHVGPGPRRSAISLDKVIAPIRAGAGHRNTFAICEIQSQLLTKFWGRPMFLRPSFWCRKDSTSIRRRIIRWPSFMATFPDDFEDFRTEPPDPNLKPDYCERFHLAGYNRIQQQEAYKFYQQWISPGFPRFLVLEIQHANPYYDDSYAVNSANLGPYGDAIETELIPSIEKQFRGIGQGWARFLYGGSTGGWEALAVQMFYPDHYNGAFVACPDPVDFRAYTTIDLYNRQKHVLSAGCAQKGRAAGDARLPGPHAHHVRDNIAYELALGSKGVPASSSISGRRCFRRWARTAIRRQSSTRKLARSILQSRKYWHEHYDLSHILQRDWARSGRSCRASSIFMSARDDTYFLNDAVYLMEDFLKTTGTPRFPTKAK